MDIQAVHRIIGTHLKELRAARGWSQREVAERARISTDFVSQAERGRRAPSVWVLTKISAVFGVHPADLLAPSPESREESLAMRDLRLLMCGRSDKQVRLVWKLAKLLFDEADQEGPGADVAVPARARKHRS